MMGRVLPVCFSRVLAMLLLVSSVVLAEKFGDITMVRVGGELLPTIDQGGYFCNVNMRFRVTNTGVKPATLRVVMREPDAIRQVRLEPGVSTLLNLQAPMTEFHASYYYRSQPTFSIWVNGVNYPHGFHFAGYREHVKGFLFSNSLPGDTLKYLFYWKLGKNATDKSYTASDSMENWSRNVYDYMGYSVIWIDANEYVPDDVKKVLRQWMIDGGRLVRCVMPEDKWPDDVPDKGGVNVERFGKGDMVTFRPFARKQREKEFDEFMNKARAYETYHSELGVDLPAIVNRQGYDLLSAKTQTETELALTNAVTLFDKSNKKSLAIESPKVSLGPLMLVMLLFAVLVGPVNYLWLRKRHKEPLLLLTIPLISLVFCIMVVFFVSFSFGFKLEGEISAFTYFDQNEKVASSVFLCSLMANSSNRKELVFGETDHLVIMEKCSPFVLDKAGMVLAPSILKPRTPLNYIVRRCEQRNERIRCILKDGKAEFVNGLPVPMEHFIARDAEGNAFKSTGKIAEGARHQMDSCANTDVAKIMEPNKLMTELCEKKLLKANMTSMDMDLLFHYLPKGSFLAICSKPCFSTPGILPDKGRANYVVFGPVAWE